MLLLLLLMQTEDFYNFADENGLLIWQDAMFGGSHYPRTPKWLDNYAEEIAQQV
jgi:beta-galactosidase/beta-glucuronidase